MTEITAKNVSGSHQKLNGQLRKELDELKLNKIQEITDLKKKLKKC